MATKKTLTANGGIYKSRAGKSNEPFSKFLSVGTTRPRRLRSEKDIEANNPGAAVAAERMHRRQRQAARGRYITNVMRVLNRTLAGATDHFAVMRPVFIVDLNDPSCVTVQIFDGRRESGKTPCVLTNRRLYGQNKFWGSLEQQPVAGKWKFKFSSVINADRVIHTDQLLFQVSLDLGELNCNEEQLEYFFGKYR